MVFLNNHARQHGGAIMVVSRSLKEDITNFTIYYRSCFLQFVNTTILPDNYQSITVSMIVAEHVINLSLSLSPGKHFLCRQHCWSRRGNLYFLSGDLHSK